MKGRSTITNLTVYTDCISRVIDRQTQVDVISTDFAKAFDSVDHLILPSKLSSFGLSSPFLKYIESYLSDRRQYVNHNGFKSHLSPSTSGVPQGSNLGPLLFLLFINDMVLDIGCNKLLFADDLKILNTIKNVNDCDSLQRQLHVLQDWCTRNKLPLNYNKCKTITFSKKKQSHLFFHTP